MNEPRMLPEALQNVVWSGVFNSEHLAQYYPLYEARLRKCHDIAVWSAIGLAALASAFLITGLVIPSDQSTLATIFTSIGLGGTVASIISSIWAYRGETVKNMALATIASSRWRHLSQRWRALWAEAHLDSEESLSMWRALVYEERVIVLETECGPFDEKLSKRAATAAKDILAHTFPIINDAEVVAEDA